MNVLVGCEETQAVTIEMRSKGHEAYSCDLKECSGGHPEWHIIADVVSVISGGLFKLQNGEDVFIEKWDMFLFFPDCTFITVSGLHWNTRIPGRAAKTDAALLFVCRLWNLSRHIPKRVMENPIGCIPTRIIEDVNGNLIVIPKADKKSEYAFNPSQIIQPYNFGEDASKATCLWIKGLPLLTSTGYCEPRIINGKKRWANQTDSGQNKLGPSLTRAKDRAATYKGIARAMAEQWG